MNKPYEMPCDIHKDHNMIIEDGCPACGKELFGPCGCCECYFCHGSCKLGVYDDTDMKEFGKEKVKPELWSNMI